jgi:hypothetical protein
MLADPKILRRGLVVLYGGHNCLDYGHFLSSDELP